MTNWKWFIWLSPFQQLVPLFSYWLQTSSVSEWFQDFIPDFKTIKQTKNSCNKLRRLVINQSIPLKERRNGKSFARERISCCRVSPFMGSFTYQVLAILVGLSAYYLLKNYKRSSMFFSDTNITLPAFLAVACAAVLVLGGLLGCCLSKDSPWMQGMVRSSAWL